MRDDAGCAFADQVTSERSGDTGHARSPSRETFWLELPEVQKRYNEKATGRKGVTWYEHCVDTYLRDRRPVERMLSLGCGTGELERALSDLKAFRSCDGVDVDANAIAEARRCAKNRNLQNLRYRAGSLDRLILPDKHYEVAWFNMTLHRVQKLEQVLSAVSRSLKPDGIVFLNEYVGPNRFDFPPRQRAAMQAAFALIPERYRCFAGDDGGVSRIVEHLALPEVVDGAAVGEAIRSSEIRAAVSKEFDVVDSHDIGGTLLQFLLNNIAGNFTQTDQNSMQVLNLLFSIEDTLLEIGEIESDFALIVARRKRD